MRTPSLSSPCPSVGDLERRARALVASAPRELRLREVGESRAGRPLWLLSAGHGTRQILAVAGAHADEPVGGASVLRLARVLARRPKRFEVLDCTWHFLLCLDPDGAALAEGWRPEGAEPSLADAYRWFYRPQFGWQPESMPVGGGLLPESAALVRLLDELRPDVQFSLHGIEFGGAFVMLTRETPGVAAAFRRIAARLGVPLTHHPLDGIDWRPQPPGVLVLPDGAGVDERDQSGYVAESTWLHPRRYGTLTTVIESPARAVTGVDDPAPALDPYGETARVNELLLDRTRQLAAAVPEAALAKVSDALIPLRTAALELLDVAPSIVETWATEEPPGHRGHSVALGISARRVPIRAAAMLRRALADTETADVLDALLHDWLQELEKSFEVRWLPLAAQTGLHVRTMIETVRRTA
ncbi:M14 family zinc carboxypeptidase [Streptomyces sp. NPDC004539]|uniref:M14 family zinc carboxypeptidase n=1 Tax=Streptomyces sp. NPDC004539 TaxID=3154280 RepID=UPI0033BCD351